MSGEASTGHIQQIVSSWNIFFVTFVGCYNLPTFVSTAVRTSISISLHIFVSLGNHSTFSLGLASVLIKIMTANSAWHLIRLLSIVKFIYCPRTPSNTSVIHFKVTLWLRAAGRRRPGDGAKRTHRHIMMMLTFTVSRYFIACESRARASEMD